MQIDFTYVLGAVAAVVVLVLSIKGAARLYFREKEKHLDRVLKKIKEEH